MWATPYFWPLLYIPYIIVSRHSPWVLFTRRYVNNIYSHPLDAPLETCIRFPFLVALPRYQTWRAAKVRENVTKSCQQDVFPQFLCRESGFRSGSPWIRIYHPSQTTTVAPLLPSTLPPPFPWVSGCIIDWIRLKPDICVCPSLHP